MRQIVALLLLFPVWFGAAQAPRPPSQQGITNAERVEHWRKDLNAFAANLHGTPIPGEKDLPGQKDLAKLYPHLDADLAALEGELPNLGNAAIAWHLAKILAAAHIAHNSILPGDPQMLPLAFEWLDEGLVVTSASAEFKTAIGSRVLKFGSLTPAAFLESVSPYISYETEGWRRVIAGMVMRRRALIELLDLVHDGNVSLTLQGSSGPVLLAVPFAPAQTQLISLREALGLPVPLKGSHPEERYYWRQLLTDSQTLYVQYLRCADDPGLKFVDFAAQTLAEIDAGKTRKVIVDLRFNQGGNSRVIQPLITGFASRRKAIGAPVVLIGPETFSSGVMAAKDLHDKANARLVGTTTGGLLGGYGESPSRKLPNTQLGMQWTIKHFPSPQPVYPDITVIATAADLRAGRDPVLAAAIAAPR